MGLWPSQRFREKAPEILSIGKRQKSLERKSHLWHPCGMSIREVLIREIDKQPEPLLREVQHYLEFLITLKDRETSRPARPTPEGWPENYFSKTAGAFVDEPFERPSQLPLEKREVW